MPQQPEKPQQPQLPNDTRTQAIGSEELPYVNEVEAALPANSSRTPKWACCNRSMSSARVKSKS